MISQTKKRLYVAAGFFSLALGFIGIFLPLLPTTPFILLAAICFSRGSERWHHWLITHPRMGPLIVDWEQYGVIRKRAKITATVLISTSGVTMYVLLNLKPAIGGVIALVFATVLTFIWTRPSEPRRTDGE